MQAERHVVRRRGMAAEEKGDIDDARKLFLNAWEEAADDFDKFLAAYYVARSADNVSKSLNWYEEALRLARQVNDEATNSAMPSLYSNLAKCYEALGEHDNAKKNYELANALTGKVLDRGPFFHGTRADLKIGDLLMPGGNSNYEGGLVMNHIYFTALANGAGLAAALAKGDGRERVYVVEPTGAFENDPNVTDKKFPGNLTRSYRSAEPLRIVGETRDLVWQTPEQLRHWRDKLADSKGEIIN